MVNAPRGRIHLRPHTDFDLRVNRPLPRGWDAVAAISVESKSTMADGLMVRNRHTGVLARWDGAVMHSLPTAKANSALAALAQDDPT